MSESTAMSVTLPQVIIEDIVKAEIVRHLGKRDDLIGSLLNTVIGEPCKCEKHRYSGTPKKSVLGCELERQIEAAIKDIIAGWISDNREKFKKELEKRLAKPDQIRALAGEFIAGISTGSWNVQVQFREKRD